ncbi:general amino acid permease agp2 [Hypoxylon texense]
MDSLSSQSLWSALAIPIVIGYVLLVRLLRYRRADSISSAFGPGKRSLSSMTTQEAFSIMQQLQQLEFPRSMSKARTVALLKAGGIPTMSKLFAVTGQNTRKNAGKRAVDTEILIREVQSNPGDSQRYMESIARMNYLHARYRKAGKILDEDLLHTLGSNVVEIFKIVDESEWRKLSAVEKCAVGIFHKVLGEDMLIPYSYLPSGAGGWTDGLHFANELYDWTVQYEERVAKPVATGDQYVRVYVDGATSSLPAPFTSFLRKTIAFDLDETMRISLNLERPGAILSLLLGFARGLRRALLRHTCLPRPAFLAVHNVEVDANPETKLYNFDRLTLQPWYVKPSAWNRWSPKALLLKAVGGRSPGSLGDRYHPGGYDLKTIGPKPQEGKGTEDMAATVEFLKTRNLTACPFSRMGR